MLRVFLEFFFFPESAGFVVRTDCPYGSRISALFYIDSCLKERAKVEKHSLFQYNKLKTTLESICGDLFNFVDDAKIGRFNTRKIKAISKEKVEIIKLIMNCDYLITGNEKLKESLYILDLMKLE